MRLSPFNSSMHHPKDSMGKPVGCQGPAAGSTQEFTLEKTSQRRGKRAETNHRVLATKRVN